MTAETVQSDDEIAESFDARRKREYIAGLREMADFMEAHPDLAPPYGGLTAYVWAKTKREMALLGLQLGTADKSANDVWFNVTRKFGPHGLQVTIARDEVCEKKVVGTTSETVLIPDPEEVAKLPKIEQTITTEKVEWICPESLHSLLEEEES